MDYETGALERPSDIEKNPAGVVKRWILEIKLADKREKAWRTKCETVWNRYRQKNAKKNSFNILWANTETLRPAVYNSLPKPDVRRRFKDADPLGKAVSDVLGRTLEYGLDTTDFDASIKACVLDMLLPGRGIARVRYVPSLAQVGTPVPDEAAEQHEPGGEALEGDTEELEWEQAPIEHVQWDDFRILCAAKEWCETTAIGFRHRMTRDKLTEMFPECGEDVQLDATDDDDIEKLDEGQKDAFKTAEVWEIWDKDGRKVLFISQGYKEGPLKTLDDPLTLQGFYPIPEPLRAVEDSSSLVPVPLYELYKAQAEELDRITNRINILIGGLKHRGVYDSTLTELAELMKGEDNDFIPAVNVSKLLDRGGLEKAIWFMPIEQAAMVLKELYVQREQVKQVIYEITGISDILRGSTNAQETATAQQIKSQWGSSRLKRMQADVSRFIRDLMRLQSEIIGERFQPETLKTMTGMQLPMLEEKQQALAQYQQQAAMAQQAGKQPPPPPKLPPAWEEVIKVLRDDKQRTFKVDVETDSTIAASMEGDMQAMEQLLGGVVKLIDGLGPAVQAGALPIEAVKELVMAVTRRARMGNAVEDAFDKMQAPQLQTDPKAAAEAEKAKIDAMQAQHQAQLDQAAQQHEQQIAEREAAMEQQRTQMEAQLEQTRQAQEMQDKEAQRQHDRLLKQMELDQAAELKRYEIDANNRNKIEVAEISAGAVIQKSQIDGANAAEREMNAAMVEGEPKKRPIDKMKDMHEQSSRSHKEALEAHGKTQKSIEKLVEVMSKPRKRVIERDKNGRATGMVETMQ